MQAATFGELNTKSSNDEDFSSTVRLSPSGLAAAAPPAPSALGGGITGGRTTVMEGLGGLRHTQMVDIKVRRENL